MDKNKYRPHWVEEKTEDLFPNVEKIKVPCLSFVGKLNTPSARCKKCGKAEWEHNI